MSGIYYRCRRCHQYLPTREFQQPGVCRCCDPGFASKRCISCGFTKPIEEFHVDRKARDGRRKECKGCRNDHKRRDWRARRDAPGRKQSRSNDDRINSLIVTAWA